MQPSSYIYGRRILALLISFLLSTSFANAQSTLTSQQIDQLVWQKLYGVTDAQINDPAWLAADDDHDGVSNGNELLAGTNPFDPTSVFKADPPVVFNGFISLTFPTQAGKLYVLQYSTDLSTWSGFTPPVQAEGEGTRLTLTSTVAGGQAMFCRVVVQDVDTAGDGVSDWAEIALGFDPTNKYTNGSPIDNYTAITALLTNQTAPTVVSVHATKATATQPALNGVATDLATLTFTRTGSNLGAVTVPLTWGGTAVQGTDYYVATPSSVTFPANATSVALVVVPLADTNLQTAVTATVTIQSGSGYLINGSGKAGVVIYPAHTPQGTGLMGTYFNGTSTTVTPYNTAIFAGTPNLTRLDPTVDFNWNSGSPGTGVNSTYFVVNWQGSVQPQYSETYYFDVLADDGVKLWVNGQLIINAWTGSSGSAGTERIGAITLTAGVLYDIKLQYYQATAYDLVHLRWYSQDQVEEVIPATQLYPTGSPVLNAPPSIISSTSTIGYVNQPFSFNVTAVSQGGRTITYGLDPSSGPLPPGLILNSATGLISGTPTTAGDYQVALTATSSTGTGGSVLDIQILPPGSGVSRELWPGLASSSISALPLTTPPTEQDGSLTSAEDLSTYPTNTGERLRGYFTAPATGYYFFWLAASNTAELWISDNSDPVNLVRRAWVTAPGTTTEQWNAPSQTNQRSPWLSLVQGQRYYYEILHNTGASGTGNNLSVTYQIDPTGTVTAPTSSTPLPRYLTTLYDYPVTLTTPGTVYEANVAPIVGTGSSAAGSATLRLNQAQTQAILHFTYSNLSSPQTSYAVYGPDDNGVETILFDLNVVDQFQPQNKTSDGGYIWNLKATSAVSVSTEISDILNGKASLKVETVKNPAGEIEGNFYLLQGSQQAPTYVSNPSWTDDSATDAGAARFLNQAAFGASPADLAYVKAHGYAAWIANQLTLPATHLTPVLTYDGSFADTFQTRNYYVPDAWWQVSINAPDQLRQRVAFALSEIFVVSSANTSFEFYGNSLTSFYDTLLDNAFGNYHDLLKAETLHPAMGIYLNMQGNAKGNLATGYHPNENYAREVMQLFSIGLNRLWPDGTLVLDSQGSPVPTYTQDTITNGLARVFTGWTWHQALQANGQLPTSFSPPADYIDPMVMVKNYHELGTKDLLDNVVLPPAVGYNYPLSATPGSQADTTTAAYDSYCLGDLDAALNSLYNHPNVGPFICRELIQRLVESNPSPAYVYRVASVFNDDGTSQHVRGNLSAVITAILLDGEARNSSVAASSVAQGKQREPLLRLVAPARTFLASSNSGTFRQSGGPVITVTTNQPHNFSPGDTVWLDFTVNANGGVEPYNDPTTQTYKIIATPTPTTFTVSTPECISAACVEAAGSTTLTITYGSAPAIGGMVYLAFTTNTALNGVYTVTGEPDSAHFTVTTANPAGTSGLTDTVYIPRSTTFPTTTSTQTNWSMVSSQNNALNPGDHFWLTSASTDLGSKEWAIASVSAIRTYIVSCTTSHINTSLYDAIMYPLVPPPWTRSGSVNLPNGTYVVNNTDSDLSQTPIGSPTVFNFYYPYYTYPGALTVNNITTPEFQLTTDSNITNLTNAVISAMLSSGNTNGLSTYKSGAVNFDLSAYMKAYGTMSTVVTTSGTTVTQTTTSTVDSVGLVNKLGDILTGGMLSSSTKTTIENLLNDPVSFPPTVVVKGTTTAPPAAPTFPTTDIRDKVRAAVQLILSSPEYAIQL